MHGKEICDTIGNKTGDIIQVPLGTVYPLLRRFISEGLIETYKPKGDQRKTIYKLVGNGMNYYNQMIILWNRYASAVNNVIHTRTN